MTEIAARDCWWGALTLPRLRRELARHPLQLGVGRACVEARDHALQRIARAQAAIGKTPDHEERNRE